MAGLSRIGSLALIGATLASPLALAQQAALVLWRRFGDYDPTRPFLPWAMGVAGRLVHEIRRSSRGRGPLLRLEVAERLAATCSEMEDLLDAQRRRLHNCVERLPGPLRQLIDLRYGERLSLAELAARFRKTVSAVNMTLHRVRRALTDCVQQEGVA